MTADSRYKVMCAAAFASSIFKTMACDGYDDPGMLMFDAGGGDRISSGDGFIASAFLQDALGQKPIPNDIGDPPINCPNCGNIWSEHQETVDVIGLRLE